MSMLPIPGGMFGMNRPIFSEEPEFGGQTQMPKPGMFGAGQGGKPKMDLVGLLQGMIGGYLAGRGVPGGNAILAMQQQRQQHKDDEEQYQRRRGDHLADYAEQQKIQAQYGSPHTNDTVEDYNFRVQTLGKEAADDWLRNPPQYMNVPGVGLVQVPRSAGPQMGAPAPQGVTFTPMGEGGPTQNGSDGFPYR